MEETDFGLFIGRFHPLVVHLPIGFIILAFVLEILSRINLFNINANQSVINIAWLLSGIASLAAVGCGWLLAENGGYGGDTLFWHKWLGIGLTVLTLGYWLFRQFIANDRYRLIAFVPFMLIGLISATGHLGGNLTHGENYLFEYAPAFVKETLGPSTKGNALANLPSPDSVVLFSDIIHPIIEEKCIQCHNNENTSGGLNLATIEGYKKGGDGGKILTPGNALKSEIFKRVTLSPKERKFMPPSGEPLSFTQIKLLSHWLDQGASFEQKLADTQIPNELQQLLVRDYNYDVSPQPVYNRVSIEPLADNLIAQLETAGFTVNPLANGSPWLQIKATSTFDKTQLALLENAATQITWLDLSGVSLADNDLSVIKNLPHLTRLRIQENDITDAGLMHLKDLQYLESLNIFNTQVTIDGILAVAELPSLKRIYAWKTQITEDQVAQIISKYPDLSIDLGISNNT